MGEQLVKNCLFLQTCGTSEHKPLWPAKPGDWGVHSLDGSHKIWGARSVHRFLPGDPGNIYQTRGRTWRQHQLPISGEEGSQNLGVCKIGSISLMQLLLMYARRPLLGGKDQEMSISDCCLCTEPWVDSWFRTFFFATIPWDQQMQALLSTRARWLRGASYRQEPQMSGCQTWCGQSPSRVISAPGAGQRKNVKSTSIGLSSLWGRL